MRLDDSATDGQAEARQLARRGYDKISNGQRRIAGRFALFEGRLGAVR